VVNKVISIPNHPESDEEIVALYEQEITTNTRLIMLCHMINITGQILPVEKICEMAHSYGVEVMVDGAHCIGHIKVDIGELGCDYYASSLHKWLSAPFGSGFLYVKPKHHDSVATTNLSWGRLRPNQPRFWYEEFIWPGTRDPSAYLAVPDAIRFLREVGLERFRSETHEMAKYARRQLSELADVEPLVDDDDQWFASMAQVPLPAGDARLLQDALWERYSIEVPIIEWKGQRYIRISCHLYTRSEDIDLLARALKHLLFSEASS